VFAGVVTIACNVSRFKARIFRTKNTVHVASRTIIWRLRLWCAWSPKHPLRFICPVHNSAKSGNSLLGRGFCLPVEVATREYFSLRQ
jgi:hypothetical protein